MDTSLPDSAFEGYFTGFYNLEFIQELRLQAAIERFGDCEGEEMEIPFSPPPPLQEEEDEQTVCYDDEEYRFYKCGKFKDDIEPSDFWELETIVPEYEDYVLTEEDQSNISHIDEDEDEDEEDE